MIPIPRLIMIVLVMGLATLLALMIFGKKERPAQ